MNRGDRRAEIFKADADRERFLETLGEVCVQTGWPVQAWCLMGNHFHLVVETPQGNLVAGLRDPLGRLSMAGPRSVPANCLRPTLRDTGI